MSACQTGLQRHPSYLSARVTLGRALQELGENAAASKEFEYVLSIAPDNLLAIRGLAELREASRGAAPAVQQTHVLESRPKEREPAFAAAHVVGSEGQESHSAEPRFGELQFAEPQFNDADFAEAQLVESLIVEPQFNERSPDESDETGRAFAQPDTGDSPVWDLSAAAQLDEPATHSHAPAETGEPSWPVDRPIYGPAEPPINPMIEAVIDRASRAQRAAQIERLEIWLQRLEELRRDLSGQHGA